MANQMLTALDTYYLVKELKSIENGKIDNIYHFADSKRELCLQIHTPNVGKSFLKIRVPNMIYTTDFKEIGTMTGFGMMLRKYLEGARIKEIKQKDFERVIEILLERKEETYRIILELFSKGNIIFCDKEKILGIIEEQEWRDRKLKRAIPYEYPKSGTNTPQISFQEFLDKAKSSNKESIVKTIAMDFSLGGIYAEYVLGQSGLKEEDKSKKVHEIHLDEMQRIYDSIKKIFDIELKPCVIDGKAYPFDIHPDIDKDKKYFENFSKAISVLDIDKESDKKYKELEKLRLIIQEQELALASCENEYIENQKKAEHIYHNYQKVDELLKKVNAQRKKHSWKEIKEMFPEIREIDEKNHKITTDI